MSRDRNSRLRSSGGAGGAGNLVALGAGSLKIWLRGDSVVLNAADVSQLTDKSGNGNHFVQATGSKQPLWAANAQAGQPGVTATAANDDKLSHAGVALGSSNTIILVVAKSSVASSYLCSGNSDSASFVSAFAGVSFQWINGADVQTLSAGATGVHILTVKQIDGASLIGYLDGVQIFSVVPATALSGRSMTTVCGKESAANGLTGNWCEFAVWTSALSATALASAHSYMKARYAL